MTNPVVFFDKESILEENLPFSTPTQEIKLLPGVIESLKYLHEAGFHFVIITNQPGIAYGLIEERQILRIGHHLEETLKAHHISLLDFSYCPHHPDGNVKKYKKDCLCRKPSPGLLWRARNKHNINLSRSWVIGDTLDDVECGQKAKCQTILINNNHETRWELSPARVPEAVVNNFAEAADFILQKVKHEQLELR